MDSRASRVDSMEPERTEMTSSKAYPLELIYVKALYLQKSYPQCISACRAILDASDDNDVAHSLGHAFLRFYIALAHDELARSMHMLSSTKLSAFTHAESLYRAAAAATPTIEECVQISKQYSSASQDDRHHSETSLLQSTSRSTLNSDILQRLPSPSPFPSPPGQTRLRPIDSTSSALSDFDTEDDLESHDSFDEIMTPGRIQRLPSTFSSMSLLDPHKHAHGLVRTVRPGPTAKRYQAAPQSSPVPRQHRSRLPRLNTASPLGSPQHTPPRLTSPVRKQLRSPDEEWSPIGSPVSPVSPLESAYIGSDDMTISPVSPSTPVTARAESDFPHVAASLTSNSTGVVAVVEHVKALRAQIETHINLIQEAKQRATSAQAERSARNNMHKIPPSRAGKLGANQAGALQSRSLWLLTPEDIKVMERQKRIEDGRQRLWARPRFVPSRYQGLAERALAEL